MSPEKIAFQSPGQGAQYVGMGEDMYKRFETAKRVFKDSDEIIGAHITRMCFDGPEEKLDEAQYAQQAILTVSYAYFKVLTEELGIPAPNSVAGHSLGEYTAHVIAGSLDFETSLLLVHERGRFMEQNPASMAVILGLLEEDVIKICGESETAIANFNAKKHFVVIGSEEQVKRTGQIVEDYKKIKRGIKFIPLKVRVGSHYSGAENVAQNMTPLLNKADIKKPNVPIIANATANYVTTPEEIRESLIAQITSPVQWHKTNLRMLKEGITIFCEIGPSEVLTKIVRRTSEDFGYEVKALSSKDLLNTTS